MPRNETVSQVKTTVLPYLPESCQGCWNKPKGSADDELAPRWHGVYGCLPVHLIELDGRITLIGYRAQCPYCRHIRWYEGRGCVFKLGSRLDFDGAKWPEIRRNGLDAQAFQRIAFENPLQRYFEASKLPKYESPNHRTDFYEPKNERCELYV